MRGHSGNFSVERLMEFLAALGQDVAISGQAGAKGAWGAICRARLSSERHGSGSETHAAQDVLVARIAVDTVEARVDSHPEQPE